MFICNPACDSNAACMNGVCSCNDGFVGDGITCTAGKLKILRTFEYSGSPLLWTHLGQLEVSLLANGGVLYLGSFCTRTSLFRCMGPITVSCLKYMSTFQGCLYRGFLCSY